MCRLHAVVDAIAAERANVRKKQEWLQGHVAVMVQAEEEREVEMDDLRVAAACAEARVQTLEYDLQQVLYDYATVFKSK